MAHAKVSAMQNALNVQGNMMIRQVIVPSKENSTISIPSEFYGMEVEVLVFPFHAKEEHRNDSSINTVFDKHLYSFSNFKFNRDEANNYE